MGLSLACGSGGGDSDADSESDAGDDTADSQETGADDGGEAAGDDEVGGESGTEDAGTEDGDTGDEGSETDDATTEGGDTCPAEADTDTMCVIIDGVRTDFYFKESTNVNDRWKAWTDDADENDQDSIALSGANVTVAETLDCTNPPPPIVMITLREDDLGNTGLTQQWMANNMQENPVCTIEVTQSAELVDEIYKGTFSGALFNSSDGTTKTVSGVFANTLR